MTTITTSAFDLTDLTAPAAELLAAPAVATTEHATDTHQRLTVATVDGWISLLYSSDGDTTLTRIQAGDIAGHASLARALQSEVALGELIAGGWRDEQAGDGFTWWIPFLQVLTKDPRVLHQALAALATMRTMTGVLAPIGLCLLQLQDALSNTLARTSWITIAEGKRTGAASLIDALTAAGFLECHDAETAALIVRAYSEGGYEDADEGTEGLEIVHSSQLTAPAAA